MLANNLIWEQKRMKKKSVNSDRSTEHQSFPELIVRWKHHCDFHVFLFLLISLTNGSSHLIVCCLWYSSWSQFNSGFQSLSTRSSCWSCAVDATFTLQNKAEKKPEFYIHVIEIDFQNTVSTKNNRTFKIQAEPEIDVQPAKKRHCLVLFNP